MPARHGLHEPAQAGGLLWRGDEVEAPVEHRISVQRNAVLCGGIAQQLQQRTPVVVVANHDLPVLRTLAQEMRQTGDKETG